MLGPALALLLAPVPNTVPDHASAAVARPVAAPHLPVAGPPGRPLVVIDPGHGGHDPGFVAPGGGAEKRVALRLALALRAALLADGRVRVALTRQDDRFVALDLRREAARALDPALFLSIHCDSAPDPQVHGASLFRLGDRASDPAAHALALRENRADPRDGGGTGAASSLPALLLGFARRDTAHASRRAAAAIADALARAHLLKPDGVGQAGLKVLRAPDMPAVLVEAGYLSNPGDRRRLASPAGERAFARAVAAGVERFVAAGG